LEHEASRGVFAVGGEIDVQASSKPVTIRWDSSNPEQGSKVSLPIKHDESSARALQQLLKDCQPATFGVGGEDVLDEEYRKAVKMDTDDFTCSLDLGQYRILYTLHQALVQDPRLDEDDTRLHGVCTELYKLNVCYNLLRSRQLITREIYSGPSGKLKAHVDTPRSKEQMGSLVICLPYAHQGGALAVRHDGREVLFDWAAKSSSSIQWAAFFSDCEHEVLPVTEGHRLTLTYNLHWFNGGPTMMATELGAVNQSALPFFEALEDLFSCPDFFPKGRRATSEKE
jgi:hypothetical protein